MIEYALHYATRGYHVFPLAPNSKAPLVSKEQGGRGCLDATRDAEQIGRWWEAEPRANIGIATGHAGLLVIDVDPRKTPEWLKSLNSLQLPETTTVRTPSGGFHHYLYSELARSITIGTNLLPGIDWRCNGGYVVAAGSSIDGRLYEIESGAVIAQAPRSLIDMLKSKPKPRPAPDSNGHMSIFEGERNEVLFAFACLARRFGLEYPAIVACLHAVNEHHCEVLVENKELEQIARSALRYAPRNQPSKPE
jgi:putative DNA primase/helicase